MAVPKKRKSISRTRKRRTHKKLSQINFIICKNCGSACHQHNVCETCGFYKGKQVLKVNKDKKFVKDISLFETDKKEKTE